MEILVPFRVGFLIYMKWICALLVFIMLEVRSERWLIQREFWLSIEVSVLVLLQGMTPQVRYRNTEKKRRD